MGNAKYTPYQERIRECFAQAYKFLDKHKHARTHEDWKHIVKGTNELTDPLTIDLIVAAVNELEREYNTYEMQEGHTSTTN